jgi:hypothetical protein
MMTKRMKQQRASCNPHRARSLLYPVVLVLCCHSITRETVNEMPSGWCSNDGVCVFLELPAETASLDFLQFVCARSGCGHIKRCATRSNQTISKPECYRLNASIYKPITLLTSATHRLAVDRPPLAHKTLTTASKPVEAATCCIIQCENIALEVQRHSRADTPKECFQLRLAH